MKKKALRKLYCCIGYCLNVSSRPPPSTNTMHTHTCALIEAQLRNGQ